MKSIRELYRIGCGPSSSHTMGPRSAGLLFLQEHPDAQRYEVELYGSLAATGKGHLTDQALTEVYGDRGITVIWKPGELLPLHPNGMLFRAFGFGDDEIAAWEVYSIGGGAIADREQIESSGTSDIYPHTSLADIMRYCDQEGITLWEYVRRHDESDLWNYLEEIWRVMTGSIDRGLETEGVLPGCLKLPRQAPRLWRRCRMGGLLGERTGRISAYAHAVNEENAAGGCIVTAPTCGGAGTLPAVLRYLKELLSCGEQEIICALATAGLIGNLIKRNASISAAEVGCQGEVGAACAMAAAAAAQLLGGTVNHIEYAAEMGIEHHLGLTCDPVCGLVQIPCIERNAHAATRALTCAEMAVLGDGQHRISFDLAVGVMRQTGHDLPSLYRETSYGGLAKAYSDKDAMENKP